jgi:putative endonuclease
LGIARNHGNAAETLAASYLELAGWVIVARNVRLDGVEVDLVAQDGRTQVLVEVKYRARADYGGAALAVDRAKRARLVRAARVLERGGPGPVRIDVLAIERSGDGATLRHYRNAVQD